MWYVTAYRWRQYFNKVGSPINVSVQTVGNLASHFHFEQYKLFLLFIILIKSKYFICVLLLIIQYLCLLVYYYFNLNVLVFTFMYCGALISQMDIYVMLQCYLYLIQIQFE